VFACGEANAVRDFIEWLWIGPSAASVSSVVVEEAETQGTPCPADFSTG
jgi:acylphosphatase